MGLHMSYQTSQGEQRDIDVSNKISRILKACWPFLLRDTSANLN